MLSIINSEITGVINNIFYNYNIKALPWAELLQRV